MAELVSKITQYWQYPFVRYAFIVSVMISLCASLLGVTLVLKRLSFIGDGLSHVAFGAMSLAAVLSINNDILFILPVTALAAVFLLKGGVHSKIKGDAGLAMMSVGALAIGYLLMNVFTSTANVSGDVCTTLFGSTSILTLSREEVRLSAIFCTIVFLFFLYFYQRIFAVTFDEDFSKAAGLKVESFKLMLSVTIAIIIVLSMKLVGSLLISALLVFPPLSAMRLFKSFKAVCIFSGLLGVLCSSLGILVAIVAGTPVGSTIVIVNILAFLICTGLGKLGVSQA